jgi:hypothetical protein
VKTARSFPERPISELSEPKLEVVPARRPRRNMHKSPARAVIRRRWDKKG